ncbi:hypothetical protein ABPG75_000919 [Micractinium tetrahymenae]
MLDVEAIGLEPVTAGPDGPPLEEESVLHKFERLQLVIGAAADQGEGTLYITEGRIIWLGPQQRGYAVGFPTVAMHAVVSAGDSAPRPCLYLQLDSGEDEEEGGVMGLGSAAAAGSDEEEEEGEGEEGEEELSRELRLIPADTSQLEALFQAFCDGAERNPDDHSDEEEGEGGGFFYDEDAALAGIASAALGVGDVDELVGADPGRFDDAEEEEGDDYEEFEEGQQQGGAGGGPRANGGC